MPRLPSGRHVAVKPLALNALCEAAGTEWGETTKLVQIESVPDLYRFIDVLYFRSESDPPTSADINEMKKGLPAGMVPYKSDFTVEMVRQGKAGWSQSDLLAFQEFLDLPRMQSVFRTQLEFVQTVKRAIVKHGDFTAAYVAGLWLAGLHPLQPGNEVDD